MNEEQLLEDIRKIMVKYGYQCRDMADEIVQAALSAKSVPEADEATTELRVVYEAARKFLRYNGVDKDKVNQAVDELDEAIEAVKHIDGGYKDFPLEAAPQVPTDDDRVRELVKLVDALLEADMTAQLNGGGAYSRHTVPAILELRKFRAKQRQAMKEDTK